MPQYSPRRRVQTPPRWTRYKHPAEALVSLANNALAGEGFRLLLRSTDDEVGAKGTFISDWCRRESYPSGLGSDLEAFSHLPRVTLPSLQRGLVSRGLTCRFLNLKMPLDDGAKSLRKRRFSETQNITAGTNPQTTTGYGCTAAGCQSPAHLDLHFGYSLCAQHTTQDLVRKCVHCNQMKLLDREHLLGLFTKTGSSRSLYLERR